MSIKAFIDFMTTTEEFYKRLELHKTKLLLDGHLTQRLLYKQSSASQRDYRFGTDYTNYAETIRKFFRRLRICKIMPIIVYNGSVDMKRYAKSFKERIHEIQSIHSNNYECGLQSPTLCNYVFLSVVREFGIDVIQTTGHPWPQVVKLANKLMCPIVTNKSEVLFMSTHFGVITEQLFDTKSQLVFNTVHKHWYLSCNALRVDCLFKCFGLRKELMPLLDVILRNRLIDRKGIKRMSQGMKGWHRSSDFEVLFNWLRDKGLNEVLISVHKYLRPMSERKSLKSEIKEVLKNYESIPSDSNLEWFSCDTGDTDYRCKNLQMLAKGDVEIILPDWFVNEYQKGVIRPALMNVVKLKTHVLYPQMEDFSQSSSYECTLSLRRFLYGILRTETKGLTKINVMDRKGLTKSDDRVEPLVHISQDMEIPFLGSIRKLDKSERRELFLSVLGVNELIVTEIKDSLKLFEFCGQNDWTTDSLTFLTIVIRFLIKNNLDIDWKPFTGAFILSSIYYSSRDLIRDDKWTHLCSAPIRERFEPKIVHQFSQMQACLHISNFINSILEFPVNEGKPYYCLNGIFLYNTTKRLSIAEEYQPFLKYLFRNWSSLVSVYNQMIRLIVNDINGLVFI